MRQQPGTAKGVLFFLLEDETGLANVVVGPRVHHRFPELVRLEPFLIVHGRLERRDGNCAVRSAIGPKLAPIAKAVGRVTSR